MSKTQYKLGPKRRPSSSSSNIGIEVSINASLGHNRRFIPSSIPLTAREVALRIKKPIDQWTEEDLINYLTVCRKFGITVREIATVIHRSPSWVAGRFDIYGIPAPVKPEKPEPQKQRRKPSPPKSYV